MKINIKITYYLGKAKKCRKRRSSNPEANIQETNVWNTQIKGRKYIPQREKTPSTERKRPSKPKTKRRKGGP